MTSVDDPIQEIETLIERGLGPRPCRQIARLCLDHLEENTLAYGLGWLGFLSVAASLGEDPSVPPEREVIIADLGKCALSMFREDDVLLLVGFAEDFIKLVRSL